MWNDTVIETARSSNRQQLDLSALGLGTFPLNSQESRRKSATDILNKIKYLSFNERQTAVDLVAEASAGLPNNLMLTTKQLLDLQNNGIEIGAHTHSHPILAELSEDNAHNEILDGKRKLENLLQEPVRFFAYPNGMPGKDYHPLHRDIVIDAGFSAALSTQWGVSDKNSDRWQLARFTPWDKTPTRFLARLLLNQRNLVT